MMWLGNITVWNQYTDSTDGYNICTQNKYKILTWTNIIQRQYKDNNFTLLCMQ